MTTASLATMAQALTAPYERGLETVEVPVGAADAAGTIALGPYDYEAYRNRYGRLPGSPRYLLIPLFAPAEPLDVTVEFQRTPGAAVEREVLRLPASRVAGRAHPIPTGELSGPALRVLSLLPQPDPPQGAAAENWRVVALAGNLAKLLWVLGAEYEELIAQADAVAAQRSRRSAVGPSLDLLGADLGVPRFPPVAYSVDAETVALYHLDDVPPAAQTEPPAAFDEVERYRPGGGHPATNVNQAAISRRPGRFRFGFGFRPGSGAALSAPDHPDFAVPAAQGLTFEAVVSPSPRVVAPVPGTIVAKRAVLNRPSDAGWGLALGSFRAIDNNLRLSISDGAAEVTLFADRDLADGAFHHVAGTVERRGSGAMVRLWIDGRVLAERRVSALAALTSPAALEIGRGNEQPSGGGAAQLAELDGVVDEVRVSRVARSVFHPALGEGDDEYRRRLGIFECWRLSTPDQLVRAINQLVRLSRGGQTFEESFVVVEDDNDLAVATRALHVVPPKLARGSCVASDGRVRVIEVEVVGTPDDDPSFDPAWLVRHDDPRVVYGDEKRRMMQRGLAAALDVLLDRVGPAPTLRILAGYEPAAAGDLASVGRALVVTVDGVDPQRLASEAVAAGFDLVCRTRDNRVRVAQRAQEALGIVAQPIGGAVPSASDIGVGDELSLTVVPSLPTDAAVRWTLIACGHGNAAFIDPSGALSRRAAGLTARLRAIAAGGIAVSVEATLHGRRAAGTRTLRIGLPAAGPNALPAGATIDGDGHRDAVEEQASGGRAPFFHPVYLVCHSAPNVDYGGAILNRRMHRRTAAALDRMLVALGGGQLRVERAFDPSAADLHAEGRALRLSHTSQPGPALAAAAFGAGFDFVQRLPNNVLQVSTTAGDPVELEGPADPTVAVDGSADLAIRPQARPTDVAFAPNGRRAFVANADSSTVSAVSIPDEPVSDLRALPVEGVALVDLHPLALVVAPNGQRLWTVSAEHRTVSVVATGPPLALASSFATGPDPVDIAVRPDGERVYVVCAGDSTLRVNNAQNGGEVASVSLPARPVAVAVAPGGDFAWIACDAPSSVVVVDLEANAVSGAPVALVAAPAAVALIPDGTTAYAAIPAARALQPIVVATRTLGAPIDVQCAPTRLVASPDGKLIWVGSHDDGVVRAVRTATGALDPARVLPGVRPSGLAARAAAGATRPAAALVCTEGDSQLALLDPSSLGTPRSPIALTIQLGAGAGERLQWTTLPADRGEAALSSPVAPAVQVVGVRPGRLLVRALYVHDGKTNPYEFELRLRPELDHPDVVLRKDQYDIVMNVLGALHPIGVEVRSRNVRDHVIEVREGLVDAFPAYTYPNFRTGSIAPTTPKRRS